MIDPTPINLHKGAALPFLEGAENLNFDPHDADNDHKI